VTAAAISLAQAALGFLLEETFNVDYRADIYAPS
jgi:hypothetical protein